MSFDIFEYHYPCDYCNLLYRPYIGKGHDLHYQQGFGQIVICSDCAGPEYLETLYGEVIE